MQNWRTTPNSKDNSTIMHMSLHDHAGIVLLSFTRRYRSFTWFILTCDDEKEEVNVVEGISK